MCAGEFRGVLGAAVEVRVNQPSSDFSPWNFDAAVCGIGCAVFVKFRSLHGGIYFPSDSGPKIVNNAEVSVE